MKRLLVIACALSATVLLGCGQSDTNGGTGGTAATGGFGGIAGTGGTGGAGGMGGAGGTGGTGNGGAGGDAGGGGTAGIGEGQWGDPVLIETNEVGDAFSSRVAIDPNGNAVAVWNQGEIWANRFTPTDGWGTAEGIQTDDTSFGSSPQVALDSEGNAVAVWSQFDGTGGDIWANRFTPTDGWGTAELIENNVGSAFEQQVALDPDGNAVAVWSQFDGTGASIWSNRFTPTDGWGTAERIETDNAGNAFVPQVAVDPNGNAVAVWEQSDGTRENIWANRFTPTDGWGAAELIETDDAGYALEPQVALDPNGNAVAVWFQSDGTRENIWANRFTPTDGWGAAELIETDNAGDAQNPQVALDPNGNAVAVWSQFDGTRNTIRANRYTVVNNWGTPEVIEDNTGRSSFLPQVALDSNGNAVAVWATVVLLFDDDDIWSNRFTPNGGWGTPELIENNVGNAFGPQVALDPNGSAIAVWPQSDGTRSNIWANRADFE